VIDEWVESLKLTHFQGRVELIRYGDDMVFTFEKPYEAEQFFRALPKRLNKYGLEIHLDKSQLIPAGHKATIRAKEEGKRIPTFNFLGMTCYWGKTPKGYWRLKYSSRRDRFATKLKSMKKWLREQLNARDTYVVLQQVKRVVKGWINYHGISDNARRVRQFIDQTKRILFKWFNRRGRRKYLNWGGFSKILKAVGFPEKWKTISMF
jgi:RNA-directed DNA polymerase